MLYAAGVTPYLIGDDRAQVIDAIALALQIAPEQTIAAATPTRRLQVLETLSEHHTRDAELLWVSRDREFEIPKDQAGLFAEIGTTFDVSLADPRIDLVAINGDLRDIPHVIAIARQANTMTALNAVTVMLPNLGVVLAGMLLGFDPVLAVLVNQCAVLLAEFNGLQLRRGRSKSHHWPLTDHGGIDPDATLSDRDLEALFTARRIDPSPSSSPTQPKRPSPGSTDFPQNPQNLAIS
ncbi:MAG: hypothetical protein HC795_17335 [Coleofasciculaceae cyanobacterium RL_1_1]|nr:hypothetical protein [Coleofasciculaceae cyanobacterium RL_1_1]